MEKITIAPTPWTTNHDGHGGVCIDDSKGSQIGFLSNRSEQDAHAALFKAAPAMTLVLQQALEALRGSAGPYEISNAREAITKVLEEAGVKS